MGAVHRFGRGGESPGHNPVGVTFGFKVDWLIIFLLFLSSYLRLFAAGENLVQPVVVLLQRFSQHGESQVPCFNSTRSQTNESPRAIQATGNQPCVFEHLQVLGDCRLRHLEGHG
jgi:hypothetical protein